MRFQESDLFTAAEKAALDLAEAMTETPPRVTDELFHRVQEQYSDAEIVEMAAIIALENFRSRFNRGCGMEAHGFYPRLGELLAAAGLPVQVSTGHSRSSPATEDPRASKQNSPADTVRK